MDDLDDLLEVPSEADELGAGGADSDWQPQTARAQVKRIPRGRNLRKTAGKASIREGLRKGQAKGSGEGSEDTGAEVGRTNFDF